MYPFQTEDNIDRSDIEADGTETTACTGTRDTSGTPSSGHAHQLPSCSTLRSQRYQHKKKMRPDYDKTDEVMALVGKKLESCKEDDCYDTFAKHVANKLRALTGQQNMFAQKMINDVLFEAEMESLSRYSRVVDMGQVQNNFGSGQNEWHPPQPAHQQIIPLQLSQQQNISTQHMQNQNIPPSLAQQNNSQQTGQPQHTLVNYFQTFEDNQNKY